MQSSGLISFLLPIALVVVMLGLGLSLSLADFRRVWELPKAVATGLFCQSILLPCLCYGIVRAMDLDVELGVGLMLLSASPGGATANLYSHLAHGDVALNITLTALNSVLSVITLPLILYASMSLIQGEGRSIPLQFDKVAQLFGLILVPVAAGIAIHAKRPALALRLAGPMKILAVVFLVIIIAYALLKDSEKVGDYFAQAGLAALAFNLVSLAVGYFVPLLLKLSRKQAIAIGMEIGIHNGAMAIAIASSPSLLNNPRMAIPAAIYSLMMYFTAGAFGWLVTRRRA